MPSIEITQDQADTLARGENVTLSPPTKKLWRYIVVFDVGNVFEVVTEKELPSCRNFISFRDCSARWIRDMKGMIRQDTWHSDSREGYGTATEIWEPSR